MTTRDEILSKVPGVPGLPTAATEVLRQVQNPDVGVSEIMASVELDPGLTSEVLRLANSAYFAGPRKVASLRDAGVLFGTQRLLQLVLTSAVYPYAKQPIRGYDLPAGQLLLHLVAVAMGAERLAKTLRREVPRFAFTAGLLHDIGKIVLGTFLEIDGEAITAVAREQRISFEVAERQVLGTDHAEVGAALLASWDIPAEVVEVTRWHHEPEQAEGDTLATELVHVVDILSIECGLGVGVDGLNYRPSPVAVERLGLTNKIAEQVMAGMLTDLDDMAPHFPGASEGGRDGL